MFDYGAVLSVSAFQAWAIRTEARLVPITRMLPPYATTYDPTVIPTINKAMVKPALPGRTATTTRRAIRCSRDSHTAMKR